MGPELKRILGREDELEGDTIQRREAARADAMLLFNPTRRRIFELSFSSPGSNLHRLASGAGVSPATAKYHLDLLVEGGLLSELRKGRARIFFPSGLVGEDEMENLALLVDPRLSGVHRAIVRGPGVTQKELVRELGRTHQSIIRAVGRLEDGGLVRRVREGRHTRYFPVDDGGSHDSLRRRRMKAFRERFLGQLRRGGFRTRVHRATRDELTVSMEAGSETVVVRLSGESPFRDLKR